MKVMETSFKRSQAHTTALSAPDPAAGHRQPHLRQRPLDTHSKSGSASCGLTAPFSWVLVHKVLFVPPRPASRSYVSPGGSMVGLMETSSKRIYAKPRPAALRGPAPAAVHC